MIEAKGKAGIKATILADSISPQGHRFTTFEILYPRIVLAELNTHRMLSKNSFSSRAVPFAKMVEQLNGRPVRFGANQAGMQDTGEDFNEEVDLTFVNGFAGYHSPNSAWVVAKELAVSISKAFYEAGYHKQVYNRLLEPWQMMKTVISGTEWDNFFWLRDHEAADPTFAELARVMNEARNASRPELLQPGEWHLPYIYIAAGKHGERAYYLSEQESKPIDLEDAIKVSCARCAAVSYRNEGYDLTKSLEVYDRLVGSDRKHASAFEHCATPMKEPHFLNGVNWPSISNTWEDGITHVDRNGNLWSGNLKGFIQYRKLIPGENYEGA